MEKSEARARGIIAILEAVVREISLEEMMFE